MLVGGNEERHEAERKRRERTVEFCDLICEACKTASHYSQHKPLNAHPALSFHTPSSTFQSFAQVTSLGSFTVVASIYCPVYLILADDHII